VHIHQHCGCAGSTPPCADRHQDDSGAPSAEPEPLQGLDLDTDALALLHGEILAATESTANQLVLAGTLYQNNAMYSSLIRFSRDYQQAQVLIAENASPSSIKHLESGPDGIIAVISHVPGDELLVLDSELNIRAQQRLPERAYVRAVCWHQGDIYLHLVVNPPETGEVLLQLSSTLTPKQQRRFNPRGNVVQLLSLPNGNLMMSTGSKLLEVDTALQFISCKALASTHGPYYANALNGRIYLRNNTQLIEMTNDYQVTRAYDIPGHQMRDIAGTAEGGLQLILYRTATPASGVTLTLNSEFNTIASAQLTSSSPARVTGLGHGLLLENGSQVVAGTRYDDNSYDSNPLAFADRQPLFPADVALTPQDVAALPQLSEITDFQQPSICDLPTTEAASITLAPSTLTLSPVSLER